MKTYITTPWHGATSDLMPDYWAAVSPADRVILIDNACDEETRLEIDSRLHFANVSVIHNEKNLGFSRANNQGFESIKDGNPDDVVIFLNSDVNKPDSGPSSKDWLEEVTAEVEPNKIYSPDTLVQTVYGMSVPYASGWCMAATYATWQTLVLPDCSGPWDDARYPGPYWEDNDLSLRAMQKGFELVKTYWQISHKGGKTTGSMMNYGDSYERNRATFARKVKVVWEDHMKQALITRAK